MIAELIFLIVLVALALPGLIVSAFEFSGRTEPQTNAPPHAAPPHALPSS